MKHRLGTLLVVVLGLSVVVSTALASGAMRAAKSGPTFHVAVSAFTHKGKRDRVLHVDAATVSQAVCKLTAQTKDASASFPNLVANKNGAAGWRWTLPSDAPGGKWSFRVACHKGQRHGTGVNSLNIQGNGSGRLVAPSSTAVDQGKQQPQGGSYAPGGGSGGSSCNWQGICFPGDPFAPGQCTWYAWARFPAVRGWLYGDAGTWLDGAKGRLPEGTTPQVGALAIWRPYTGGSHSQGHVAYVVGVSGGNVTVDDSNWVGQLQVGEHTVPASWISGYIYPPGGGPSVPPSAQPRIGGLTGNGSFFVKEGGLASPWVRELQPGDAKYISVAGQRLAAVTGNNSLFIKEGALTSSWVRELQPGDAQQVALTPTRIAAVTGCGALAVKEGSPYSGWVQELGCHDAQRVAVGGNRIAAITGDGSLFLKDGSLYAAWVRELQPGDAQQIAVTQNRLAAITKCGALFVKEGPAAAAWVKELDCGDAKRVALGGNRIAAITGNGSLVLKDGSLYAAWVKELGTGDAKAVSVTQTRIGGVNGCSAGFVKEGPADATWTQELGCGDAKFVAVADP